MPNLYNIACNDKLSPYLEAASVDTGGRLFASSPGDISPRWQARKGVTGGQVTDGNRNGTLSQTIADFFHENKWVRIVYSTFRILDPRPLPRFSVAWGRGYTFQTSYYLFLPVYRCTL